MSEVRIAELKAKLSEHLRKVRRGETVTVMDRDTPIAVISPFDLGPGALRVRAPDPRNQPQPGQVELPEPLSTKIDIVELLLAERQIER